ncbi:ArsI/CadI family heavy metal resistance metalloenzyme [Thalassoglobus sp. JC818]|uniref:ArsI/CadI family heavy metal resistance metalloenzyme n=1 Tax=Thalassoglobus sp. JC818 TaxID=3232136 RepID=UPI00345B0524
MTSLSDSPVTFHISVNVSDIDRSVVFFSKVFNTPPAKHQRDYAKFELQNPPMTFSLEPINPTDRGTLNHLGFKFQSAEELVAVQRRLEIAGIRSEREEGVECCYSRQTKFWLHDPDGTLWEMYILEGDIEHRGAGQSADSVMGTDVPPQLASNSMACDVPGPERASRWQHRLGSPLEIPVDYAEASLDNVALQGTFNGPDTEGQLEPFLKSAATALKPGGTLYIHCLTADRHLDEVPELPGPASVVKSVPCLNSLIDAIEIAGLSSVRLTTYRPRACFTAGDAELRETKIEAIKPVNNHAEMVPVVFRGPFPEIKLDSEDVLRRGRRTELPRGVVDELKTTPMGDLIVVLEAATSPISWTA